MKTYKYFAILLCLIGSSAFAQNSVDVLRYSQITYGGTARFVSMGGAFGAIGADFSTLSMNPAGIGLYKKSSLSFTPTIYVSNTSSKYNDNTEKAARENFNMNNAGVVFVSKTGGKAVNYMQFGFGVNRLANYNHNVNIRGDNSTSSLMTDFQNQAYDVHPDYLNPITTMAAWQTYLLEDTVRENGRLTYTSQLENGGINQEKEIRSWGSTNEMVISGGGSLNDRVYFGATIGIPFVRYFEESTYIERDEVDTLDDFNTFFYDNKLETTGSGINFKVGVIVRPVSFLRLGISYQSPTRYSLDDVYSSQMVAYYDSDPKKYDYYSGQKYYSYRLSTPMRTNLSAAMILGRFLIVSLDYEYVNYSTGNLDSENYSFAEENSEVRHKYDKASNIRAGAELRLRPFSFRGGAAYYGDPYADDINKGDSYTLSAGLGYRDRFYFIDFAYSYNRKNEDYYLYDPNLVNATSVAYHSNRFLFTVGFKF